MTATLTNANWTADMAAGEHASTVYARLSDTFAADPILAMFVPQMRNGLLAALITDLTVQVGEGGDIRRVAADGINAASVMPRIVAVVESSPLSVLRGRAIAHLAESIRDGLFPATAARYAAEVQNLSEQGEGS